MPRAFTNLCTLMSTCASISRSNAHDCAGPKQACSSAAEHTYLYSKQALALSLLPDGGQQLHDTICIGADAIRKSLNDHVENMEDLQHNR